MRKDHQFEESIPEIEVCKLFTALGIFDDCEFVYYPIYDEGSFDHYELALREEILKDMEDPNDDYFFQIKDEILDAPTFEEIEDEYERMVRV